MLLSFAGIALPPPGATRERSALRGVVLLARARIDWPVRKSSGAIGDLSLSKRCLPVGLGTGELALSERDYESEEQSGGRPGVPIDPLRLWDALRKRWQLVVFAGVLGAFIGAAYAKKGVANEYAASGIITWNVRNYSDYQPEEREAIVESMLFASNVDEVRKRLKLNVPTDVLSKIITVAPSQKSNNISIDATWGSPDGAANLVNTLIDVFIEWRHKIITDRLQAIAQRYRDAVQEAEKRQTLAAKAYDDFRRESGITDISQERELAIQQAALLSTQFETARTAADGLRAQADSLRSAAGNNPAPEANKALTEVDREQAEKDKKRLSEARGEFASAKQQFSSDHPTVRRLEAEIAGIEARVKARGNVRTDNLAGIEEKAKAAFKKQQAAESLQKQLQSRLNELSSVEGKAAVLLGERRVAEEALDAAKALFASTSLEAQNPPSEFRVLERAFPAAQPLPSKRKNIALGFPIGFFLGAALLTVLWSIRKLDVRTPKEAAFWSSVPVVGASTWPRDPDMLSSLMHDLDDYAPHCEGVTLIVGASLDEAHLARRVAEWDGHRIVKSIDDPQRLLAAGQGGSAYPLARPGDVQRDPREGRSEAPGAASNMQILTLTGPVPAQALRRAARLADRVMVVVGSGKHSVLQLMKIKARLGRDQGIGVLLVGLDKEYAMVRDRVGDIERFWHATRAQGDR
jgi:uncharacterized protein involved in exopolysaccharide biosynthesis